MSNFNSNVFIFNKTFCSHNLGLLYMQYTPLSDAHVTWHCLKRRVHCGGEQMWCSIVPNIYLSLSAGYRTFCFNGKFIRRWNLSEASAQHWSNWLQYFSLIILLNTYIDVGNLVENWYALGICSICLGWKILWSIMQIITFAGIEERKKFNSSFYNVY